MKKIIIPETELEVSPLGLGCVNAGLKWDGKDADYVFDAFLDMGGNLYDTARVYSDWVAPERGRSERVLGDWLARSGKRNEIVIASKGGHPDMSISPPNMHSSRMRRADMYNDIELSLKALRTDYVDLYFYHRDDETIPVEELIETMESLVKEGKTRYYACSNWSTKRMRAADEYCKSQGYRGFAANQALFNLGTETMKPMQDDTLQSIDGEMQKYHVENRCNVAMPYMGICSGFFNNYIEKGADSVKDSPYYTPENIRLAGNIRTMMDKYGATVTQAVLGFFTCREFLCLPLFGPRDVAGLKEAMGTFEIPFEKKDFESQ